jgi:hypothetical protein
MNCQKIINVLALSSAAVSLAVVGTAGYVFVNKDALLDGVKSQVMEAVTGSLGDALGGDLGGALMPSLPTGSNDVPGAPQVSSGSPGFPIPSGIPF